RRRIAAIRWLGALVAIGLAVGTAHAARSVTRVTRTPQTNAPARVQTIDVDRRIDVNNVNMYVVNNGAFAYDLVGLYNGGFFYPNHTAKTAIYAAGLWIGAKVGGETRLAVAEYDQEYR